MAKVIVFGPTGNIGSVAARTAQEHGAKVFLAMRDTQKAIPGLSAEQEKTGGYERVQADLTQPETVAEAVKKTGATRAFTYLAMGSKDHMKATVEALKSAGIEFVVFLSSFTVHGNPAHDFKPSELIPFVHAKAEHSFDAVYGQDNYVAVRPGGFVTNLLRYKQGITSGDVRIYGGGFKIDCITPGDMGRVSGTILAEGKPRDPKQTKVYLYGPQLIPMKDALSEIGQVLGKELKVTEIDEDEALEQFAETGMPKPFVDYMMGELGKVRRGEASHERTNYDEGVKNVQLYTGRPSTGLKEWTEENKAIFA